ncbi:hypothetical protein L6164_021910 [Bauhinia variegata]|uniref:Uncharacterized protein n=1 Tax=Bauhinia variegata TaxID=167791 RepID=A0ACB9MDY4_BAUVA|nr:hypothetical protein L6164_021910 [Bauhinia variegata]
MYAAPSNATSSPAADYFGHLPSPDATMSMPLPTTLLSSATPMHSTSQYHFMPDQLALNEFDSLHDTFSQFKSEMSHNSSSSGCSSYGSPSSLASYRTRRPNLMQRSVSSHALMKNGVHHPVSPLFAELLDSENAPVRRVYSTGDLQRIMGHNHLSDSSLSSESSMIIEGMSRACRYSPEEKKVRIERYRNKRNLRNFNKKIKYACRKTLADSRPRIRGRFARNEEIDKNTVGWSHIGGGEEEDEEDENWVDLFDSLVAASLVQDPQDSSSSGLMFQDM